MAIVSRKNEFIFFHIPKCGGTSLSNLILEKDIIKNIDNTHYTYADTKIVFEINGEKSFFEKAKKIAIIRNPFNRTESLYKYIMQHKNHYLHDKIINKSFTEFCYYLRNIGDEKIISCKQHLIDECGIIDNSIRIFKLEEINVHLEELSEILRCKIDMFPHENKSKFYFEKTVESTMLIKDIFSDDIDEFYN